MWSLGSLLINVTIIIHQIMARRMPAGDPAGRFDYVIKNWDIYGLNWRVEWVLMAMIAAGAIFFAIRTRTLSWAIISGGQVLLLLTYPVLLAGYLGGSLPMATLVNRLATEIFVSGNMLFLAGLLHLYLTDEQLPLWARYPAAALALVGVLAFVGCNFGLLTLSEIVVAAPVLQLLYVVNSYYGLIVPLSRQRSSRDARVSVSRTGARPQRVSS